VISLSGRQPRLAPSILDSDLTDLAGSLRVIEEAGLNLVHLDVMDGHFVPNISIGLPVVASIRRRTSLTLDVHLMIEEPERYIERFVEAGADILTIQAEATPHVHRALQLIEDAGAKVGLAFNPGTPVTSILELLPMLDLVLVMSVNPGFGGQRFIEASLDRIRTLREWREAAGLDFLIEVDGGINFETIPSAVQAGADLLVAGSAIFGNPAGPAAAIRQLTDRISTARRLA
jgi:ribulose-phosphate 3-epimerase